MEFRLATALSLCFARFALAAGAAPANVVQVNPGAKVTSIIADDDGFVWFATEAGLARGDGKTMVFAPFEGEPKAVCIDKRGTLWAISSRDKLFTIDGTDVRSFPAAPAVHANALACTDLHVWVGASNGLFRMNRDTSTLERVESFPKTDVRAIAIGRDDELLVGTDQGAFKFGTASPYSTHRIGASAEVTAISQDHRHRIWVCYRGKRGAAIFSDDGAEIPSSWRNHQLTHALLKHSVRGMWLGTDLGIYLAQELSPEPVGLGGGFDPRIVSLASYSDGTLWAGSVSSGALLIDPEPGLRVVGRANGLSSELVFSVASDSGSSIWATTTDSLVNINPSGVVTALKYSRSGVPFDARSLSASTDGVWVSSRNYGGKKVGPGLSNISHNGTRGLIFEDAQQGLWTAPSSGGLIWQPPGGQRREVKLPQVDEVVVIAQGRKDQILIGTAAGKIFTVTDGHATLHPRLTTDSHLRTLSLAQFSSGVICASRQDGGLWCADSHNIRRYSFSERIELVGGMVEDEGGSIWLCTTNGIVRIASMPAPLPSHLSTSVIGLGAGLKSVECPMALGPSAAKLPNGMLVFATAAGLVQIDPVEFQRPPSLHVVINDVRADGAPLSRSSERLPANTRTLQFEFRSPRFLRHDEVTFRYRLDGQDTNWTAAKSTQSATYTNLPAGLYRFVVEANDGYATRRASITFFKQAHWSKTFVARLGFAALLAFALLASYLAWKSIRRHKLEIMRVERQRLAQEIHDTVDQNVVGVRLQLETALMKLGRATARTRPSWRHIERACAVLGMLSQSMHDVIYALRVDEHTLPLDRAVARSAQRLFDGTQVTLKIEAGGHLPTLPLAVRHQVLAILGEGITNAVNHGHARNIVVKMRANPRRLQIDLIDDGHGFDVESAELSGRFGLVGMKERASKFRGWVDITSSVGKGTTVKLHVPH